LTQDGKGEATGSQKLAEDNPEKKKKKKNKKK